jgi:hypothetical protein
MTNSRRFEFKRASRLPQILRAFIIVLVGAAVIIGLPRLSLQLNSGLQNIIVALGGCVAVSGIIAVLLLLFVTIRNAGHAIEVDENGLTLYREGKDNQSLKWADVSFYEAQESESFFDIESFTNTDSMPSSSTSDPLGGCIFGLILGLYLIVLDWFIQGSSWRVKFKLKSRRVMSITGYGTQMDELVEQILPRFLPDKRKLPKQAEQKEENPEGDGTV